MPNYEEYGAAHFVLKGIRNNKNATYYDPPYPKPKEVILRENAGLVESKSSINESLKQLESSSETEHADRIGNMIYSCLLGRRIEQRDLFRAKDLQPA